MLVFDYPSKKEMKENHIGKPLRYMETSIFGAEYRPDGMLVGCNRPHITGHKREFYAQVRMENGVIAQVK